MPLHGLLLLTAQRDHRKMIQHNLREALLARGFLPFRGRKCSTKLKVAKVSMQGSATASLSGKAEAPLLSR
jgi:hypothetical protein